MERQKEFGLALAGLILSPFIFFLLSSEGERMIQGIWWWLAFFAWLMLCGAALRPFIWHHVLEALAPRRRFGLEGVEPKRDFEPLVIVCGLFLFGIALTAFVVYGHMLDKGPQIVGDPQDQATIRRLIGERIRVDDDRDQWKGKFEKSDKARELAGLALDAANQKLDDRERKMALRTDTAAWLGKLRGYPESELVVNVDLAGHCVLCGG